MDEAPSRGRGTPGAASRRRRVAGRRAAATRTARRRLFYLVLAELLVSAAVLYGLFNQPNGGAGGAVLTPAPAATQPLPTALPALATPVRPATIWMPDLPASLAVAIRSWAAAQSYTLLPTESGADLAVTWTKPPGAALVSQVVLVPVAAFPSSRDSVAGGELRRAWRGRGDSGDTISRLFVTPNSGPALQALWDTPGDQARIATVLPAALAGQLSADEQAVALVTFDDLEPRLKVLPVDGMSAVDPGLDVDGYPLVAPLWAGRSAALAHALAAEMKAQGLATDRRADRLTVLAMTGVTALTRNVAIQIEARADPGWPARQVAGLLSSADLTHVSNEVSFMPGCPARVETTAFCAKPEYMETLRLIGADIVELTGNHNLDFGPDYALRSLDLYEQAGLHTFGGGRNAVEARRPLVVQHHGNRLAFLGYNTFGPGYAWATEKGPGAARFSLDAVRADVAAVRPSVDLVFVELQYTEVYTSAPLPEQVLDFRAVAQAGADVVVGTQAHQPQAIEFLGQRPIFYGLGNLFFDQTWSAATRQSLIAWQVIYDGRLIAVELIPTSMGDDCQPYVATGAERQSILQQVFDASRKLP